MGCKLTNPLIVAWGGLLKVSDDTGPIRWASASPAACVSSEGVLMAPRAATAAESGRRATRQHAAAG